MSLQYSNTTTKRGILQSIERMCLLGDGGVSGNATRKAQFTADINEALDEANRLIIEAGGTWQWDDSNHTSYPIITTDLVAGQRDYSFTQDSGSNIVLEIMRVFIADSTGLFREITPVDVPEGAPSNYYDGLNTQGIPNSYDKLGNGIFLDPIPNYNRSGGLKIYVNREASYFTTSDTIKKPGIAGIFHEYLAIRPSYRYARDNGLANVGALKADMLAMESQMQTYYANRERDKQKQLMPRRNNAR